MVSLTIDNKKVQVPADTTVLVAARTVGIKIPTLCYHPRLTNFGGCRLCIVQIKGIPRPVTSCTTPVSEGMEVVTSNEEIGALRKTVIELILSDHPTDCPKCEQSGNCQLQDIAYTYGGFGNRFIGERQKRDVQDENPFIRRDMNKCILCGRCVRVCHEVQGVGAIDFTNRGFKTLIETPFKKDLNCEFCGQCISVCPTGALTGKIWEFKGWQKETVDTVCPFCGTGCNITLHVKGNEIIRVDSKETTWNEGLLCVKGRFGYSFVNSPERLTKPLIRKQDKKLLPLTKVYGFCFEERYQYFREASWDEALDFVASRLSRIKEKHGPDAIGGMSSARCTNEENYLFQKFMRTTIGTNNIDQCARLCHAPSVASLANIFGSGSMTNSIEEIDELEVIFIVGSNTKETHPVIANRMIRAKRRGAKIILADPRKIYMSRFADISLHHNPGTDIALLNAIAYVIVSEGLHNKEFISEKTEGFDAWLETIQQYTPEYAQKVTGVDKDKIIKAGKIYGSSRKAGIFYTMGITQHICGTDNVSALDNLVLLTGNIGRRGTGINPLRGQNNVQGASDAGCSPVMLPGYQKLANPALKTKFEYVWGLPVPSKQGLNSIEMINAISNKNMKALYIIGENPLMTDPNIRHVFDSFRNLELLIVQDIFLTETGMLADVIFPAASFAEKDGTFTNTDRRVQRIRKALQPPGEAISDLEIIMNLSEKLGKPMKYKKPEDVWIEYGKVWPAIAGITYQRLDKKGIQWPCPTKDHPGTRFLYQSGFPIGKAKFSPIQQTDSFEKTDNEYNYLLITGRNLFQYHSGSMTRKIKAIEKIAGTPYVEISDEDMRKLAIEEGETVRVQSRRGSVTLLARRSKTVKEGLLFIPMHYAE
ncbi:MAG: formate dehydrogenase subunit alpha, partial [Thermodesulfovibrionales bacterium]|nr:formate dehydrogenase subunit alpha [Thermodesulfovibrionales bacterium]